jgi:hypothetical protein
LASAWSAYKRAEKLSNSLANHTKGKEIGPIASARAADTFSHLSFVTVTVAESVQDLVVKRNGVPIPSEELGAQVPLDSGSYLFEATAPGKDKWEEKVDLSQENMKVTVVIRFPLAKPTEANSSAPEAAPHAASLEAMKPAGMVSVAPQPEPTRPTTAYWTVNRKLAVIVASAGAVSLGVGSWLALSARADFKGAHCDSNNKCDSRADLDTRTDAVHRANWATLPIGMGVAAIGTGIAVLVPRPSRAGREQPAPTVSFSPNAVTIRGRF